MWPWLTQIGWHLGGYYTPEWVDRYLFPANWSSLDHLDPALVRDLRSGDVIPDGPPGTAHYVVHQAIPPHLLVLRSTTHLPPGWGTRFGTSFVWTWCFHLSATSLATGRGSTCASAAGARRCGSWPCTWARLMPADLVMATGMLRGLKRRAESPGPLQVSGREPYGTATVPVFPSE